MVVSASVIFLFVGDISFWVGKIAGGLAKQASRLHLNSSILNKGNLPKTCMQAKPRMPFHGASVPPQQSSCERKQKMDAKNALDDPHPPPPPFCKMNRPPSPAQHPELSTRPLYASYQPPCPSSGLGRRARWVEVMPEHDWSVAGRGRRREISLTFFYSPQRSMRRWKLGGRFIGFSAVGSIEEKEGLWCWQ